MSKHNFIKRNLFKVFLCSLFISNLVQAADKENWREEESPVVCDLEQQVLPPSSSANEEKLPDCLLQLKDSVNVESSAEFENFLKDFVLMKESIEDSDCKMNLDKSANAENFELSDYEDLWGYSEAEKELADLIQDFVVVSKETREDNHSVIVTDNSNNPSYAQQVELYIKWYSYYLGRAGVQAGAALIGADVYYLVQFLVKTYLASQGIHQLSLGVWLVSDLAGKVLCSEVYNLLYNTCMGSLASANPSAIYQGFKVECYGADNKASSPIDSTNDKDKEKI